jgi:predicted ATP-dependent endonuclease of OLD family
VYIYKIKIKNFRSIKEIEWKPNERINLLLGGNGSGKSSLATAIDYLLNPNISWYRTTLSEIDFNDRDINNNILIEVWFKGVEEIVNDDLELLFEHVDKEDNISIDGDELVLITRMTCDRMMKPKHSIVSNGKEVNLSQTHKQALNYKMISADRDPLRELAFYNNSLLSKILQNENTSVLIQKIIEELDNSAERHLLGNDTFKASFNKLKESFADFNLVAATNDSLGLEVTELSERKTLQAFSLVFKEEGMTNPIPLKYQSRGIKNLMLLVALQNHLDTSSILFLEEIEQNLEPHLQRKIVKSFKKKINGQIFLTTHSPEVVKLFDFGSIYMIREGDIVNVPKIEFIDKKFEKLVERQAKYELVSGLFAKGVLLVEGESEKGGLPIFSEAVESGLEEQGIELVYCSGKDNVISYNKFYENLGIPSISLLDNDDDIENQLGKLRNSKNPIIIVPEDYEGGIIASDSFQEKYVDIFETYMSFKVYKDNYIKPFKANKVNSKNNLICAFYAANNSAIDGAKNLHDIVCILPTEELKQYQKLILHSYLASIPSARYVACDIVDGIETRGIEGTIPLVFDRIFKLANNYIAKKCLCEERKSCVIQHINKQEVESQDICIECGNVSAVFPNTVYIRGDI